MRLLFLISTLLTLAFSSVAESATLTLQYDQVGNLTSGYGKYYEYNDSNQLVKVRKDSSSSTVIAEYFYDYQGQRVKKIENGITTYYIGKHYEERNTPISIEQINYYFANGQKVAKKIAENYGTPKYFYILNNHLGSADVITDESGNEVDRLRYYPYGEYRTEGKERYSFTGKERDEVTDNYYFEARYYNPTIRRFTQADTVTPDLYDPQSLNRYAYTRNSPLVYTDPSGHFFDIVLDIAFIANDIKTLVTDPSSRTLINYVALGADVAGAFIPGATGLGAGVKLASAAISTGIDVGTTVAGAASTGLSGEEFLMAGVGVAAGVKGGRRSNINSQINNSHDSFPKEIYDFKAPEQQVTPGIRKLEGVHLNDKGRVEPWTAYYDEYGRFLERTDWNAENLTDGIPMVHHHTKKYGSYSYKHGVYKEDHILGVGSIHTY